MEYYILTYKNLEWQDERVAFLAFTAMDVMRFAYEYMPDIESVEFDGFVSLEKIKVDALESFGIKVKDVIKLC